MHAPFVRLLGLDTLVARSNCGDPRVPSTGRRTRGSSRSDRKDMSPRMATRHVWRRAPRLGQDLWLVAADSAIRALLRLCLVWWLLFLVCLSCYFILLRFDLGFRLGADALRPCGLTLLTSPLRVDSSVADPSLAFRVLNGGPSCPIVSTIDSSSNGDPQGAALQTFLQRRKNGRGPLAPQPAVHWLGAPGSVPLLLPEVRLRGITHESGEQLALSRPRNCRVGPVDIPAGLLLLYTMRQAGLGKWWLMSVISRKSGAFPAPVRGFPSKSRDAGFRFAPPTATIRRRFAARRT